MGVSLIEELIGKHTDSILSASIQSPQRSCPHCFEISDTFKLHESRKRGFRFIVGGFVRIIISLLVRWKCPICGRTFTAYPDFALPYKRYVLMDIEGLSEDYLENEKTYQQTVSCEGEAIGYEERDGKIDERQLSASTPFKMAWFSGWNEQDVNRNAESDRTESPAKFYIPATFSPLAW